MTEQQQVEIGKRFWIGISLFFLDLIAPTFNPLIESFQLSSDYKLILSCLVNLLLSHVVGMIAIAIMGKEGYNFLKTKILKFFKLAVKFEKVGRVRYSIGLTMFIFPLLLSWLEPYLQSLIPDMTLLSINIAFVGDLIFVTSFIVLGADFWDKIRALFLYNARAQFYTTQIQTQE